MSEDQLGVECLLEPPDHFGAADPGIVISREPAMGVIQLVILGNVKLIRRPDKGPVFG